MPFTSAFRFVTASSVVSGMLTGLVALAAGGALAIATAHHAPTSNRQTSNAAAPNDQGKNHGAEVKDAVAKCKAALAPGQHGIGKCVSAIANKHGKAAGASPDGQNDGTQNSDGSDPTTEP